MAKDIKTMTVPPEYETDAIQLWMTFGYDLLNNQEVLAKDTRLEQGVLDSFADTYTQVTETIHYIKLTFQRETNIPHYAELKRLEQEYDSLPHPGEPPQKNGIIKIFFGLMLCTIPGIIFIIQDLGYNSNMAEYNKAYSEYVRKRDDILERARALSY
jgi:hypothetical protein